MALVTKNIIKKMDYLIQNNEYCINLIKLVKTKYINYEFK